jgi:hypothetical protein
MKPTLYSFWRSSAAFRVRIALNLKGIDYDIIPIHLRKGGGEQLKEPYQALNPNGLVPLYMESDVPLHQSAPSLSISKKNIPALLSYQILQKIEHGFEHWLTILLPIFIPLIIYESYAIWLAP